MIKQDLIIIYVVYQYFFLYLDYNKEAKVKYPLLDNPNIFQKFLTNIKVNLSISQYSITDEYKFDKKEIDLKTFLKHKHMSNYNIRQSKTNQNINFYDKNSTKDDLEKVKQYKNVHGKTDSTSGPSSFNKHTNDFESKNKYTNSQSSKSFTDNQLSDVLIATRAWQDTDPEYVIIRVFEGDSYEELLFSIEEYPVQNQSYLNVKKNNKKLTTMVNSGLNSFKQKFNIFQKSLKSLKEKICEIDQLVQNKTKNTTTVEKYKLQIYGMLQEAVILKNKVYCLDQYLNVFIKKINIKTKNEQINLDMMLTQLNNYFPQLDIHRDYIDKSIQNDFDKIMYILIAFISNASTCARIMPIQLYVQNITNQDPSNSHIRSPLNRIRTNDILQDQNISNNCGEGINQHQQMTDEEDRRVTPQQTANHSMVQINNKSNRNLTMPSNSPTRVFNQQNLGDKIQQNQSQNQLTFQQNNFQNTQISQIVGSQNLINLNTCNPKDQMQTHQNQNLSQNHFSSSPQQNYIRNNRNNSFINEGNNSWEGVLFKISFYHEKDQRLMDNFNCSEDKDSQKIESKILKKMIKNVGPQQTIICKTSIQMKDGAEEEFEQNGKDQEQYSFYSNHFKQFYQKPLQKSPSRNNLPGQTPNRFQQKKNLKQGSKNYEEDDTKEQFIQSSFELIVYKNSDIINNPFFIKQRQSVISLKTHFLIPKLNTEDALPRIKTSSSNIQLNPNSLSNLLNPNQQIDGNYIKTSSQSQYQSQNYQQKSQLNGNSLFPVDKLTIQGKDYEEEIDSSTHSEIHNISEEIRHTEKNVLPQSISQKTLPFLNENTHDNLTNLQSFNILHTQIIKEINSPGIEKQKKIKQDSQQHLMLNCENVEVLQKQRVKN